MNVRLRMVFCRTFYHDLADFWSAFFYCVHFVPSTGTRTPATTAPPTNYGTFFLHAISHFYIFTIYICFHFLFYTHFILTFCWVFILCIRVHHYQTYHSCFVTVYTFELMTFFADPSVGSSDRRVALIVTVTLCHGTIHTGHYQVFCLNAVVH